VAEDVSRHMREKKLDWQEKQGYEEDVSSIKKNPPEHYGKRRGGAGTGEGKSQQGKVLGGNDLKKTIGVGVGRRT